MSRLYSPLSFEAYEVRMLTLSRDAIATSGTVECTMKTVSLVYNPPKYVALSYCWGDENLTKDIVVNGTTKAVTINLEEALQQLRGRMSKDIMLWVDSVCINQNDVQERSQQVRFMKLIYEKADRVYAWLGGEGFEDALHGLRAARNLRNAFMNQNDTSEQDLLSTACTGLFSVCRCPYWQRRWIIQELTAASEVEVLCITESIMLEELNLAYLQCSKSRFWLSGHELISDWFAQTLRFRRRFHDGQQLSLSEAILDTRHYLSKDARDKIYALIGICYDGPSLVPTPNYFQSIEEICIDLTRAMLQRNANFDLILTHSRTDHPNNPISLPSWCPDWFSPELQPKIARLANEEPSWPRSFATVALRANKNNVKMQGVTLGTVTALTSPLSWENPCPRVGTSPSGPFNNSSIRYYGSKRRIASALTSCVLSQFTIYQEIYQKTNIKQSASILQHIFLWSLRFKYCRGQESNFRNPQSALFAWQQFNGQFRIDDLSISDCLRLRHLKKRSYVGPLILLVLLSLAPISISCMLKKNIIGAVLSMGLFGIIFSAYLHFVRKSGWHWVAESIRLLSWRIDKSQRLFILDRGVIGMAHANTKIGDKTCVLAACNRLAVLREHKIHGSVQYSVVGNAIAGLNRSDEEKYPALYRYQNCMASQQQENAERLEEYKEEAWWETFTLT